MLLASIKNFELPEQMNEIIINDPEKIQKIIKIFLALRKGLSNNLNFKSQLKGMLYNLDNPDSQTNQVFY